MKLINGDCYKAIKEIEDNSVDLVIIDPPYVFPNRGIDGGSFGTDGRTYHQEVEKVYSSRQDKYKAEQRETLRHLADGFDLSLLDEFKRIQPKINLYVWCSKAQVRDLLNWAEMGGYFTDILAWHKTNPIPTCNGTYLNDTEYCIFIREKGAKVYGDYYSKAKYWVSKANVEDKKLYEHPTIKPLWIIKKLIYNSSLEGQVVLDCFMGSGTTGVACKELGREFIGIEIDQHYFEIAERRINSTEAEEIEEMEGQLKFEF